MESPYEKEGEEDDHQYSFEQQEFIDKTKNIKSTLRVHLIALNAVLGAFYFGYEMAVLNTSAKKLQTYFNWTDHEKTVYQQYNTTLVPIGALIGSFFGGLLSKYGRKFALIVVDVISVVGISICLFAIGLKVEYVLFSGRFICGVAVGLQSTVIPLYIKEMTPFCMTGQIGTYFQLFIVIGTLIPAFFALGLKEHSSTNNYMLYIMFGLPPIFTSVVRILVILLFFNFDTPKYYVIKNQISQAKKILKQIYVESEVGSQLKAIENDAKGSSGNTITYRDLFTRLRYPLMIGCLLAVFQQLSGVNAVIFFSDDLFKNVSYITPTQATIIVIFIQTLATFTLSLIIERFGRKPMLIIGQTVILVTMLGLIIVYNYNGTIADTIQIILVAVFLIGFSLSTGPITWIYAADILPDSGISIANTVNWMFTALIAWGVPEVQQQWSIQTAFYVFFFASIVGQLLMIFGIKESKGKTQIEIWNAMGVKSEPQQ